MTNDPKDPDGKLCTLPECHRLRFSYGFCSAHANNFKRRGDPRAEPARKAGLHPHCTHAGCADPHYSKGLCRLHYRRQTEGQHDLDCPPCGECGGETPRSDALFCSAACKMRWHRREGCYSTPDAKQAQRRFRRGAYQRAKADPARYRSWRSSANRLARDAYAADPEKFREQDRRWAAAHPDLVRLYSRARAKRLRRQTPAWADRKAIERFYAACPRGMVVDHDVPLKGAGDGLRNVSGLHVAGNLRYLTPAQNLEKGNRFEPRLTLFS